MRAPCLTYVGREGFGFSVSLTFAHGNDEFELTRECRPKRDTPPSRDTDYDETRRLRRGGEILGPQERDQLLPSLFPEQVSRFFLFDGELLQEYEELLYDESVAGRRISESIERILGVPLIRDARAHVSLVLEEAEKATAREASRSEETRSIGTALEQATELRASQRDELERLENQLQSLHAARRAAEAYLESVERYRQLIADREVAREELGTVTPRLGEITVEIRDLMREAWRTVLAEPVRRGRDQARRAAEDALDSVVKGLRRKAVETGSCEVCEQEVSADQRSVLASGLSDDGEGDALTLGVSDGLRRLTELEKFRERHVEEAVIQLEDERRTLSIRKVGLSDRIREVETELADADTDEIESEGQSLREVEQKIRVVETGITGQREEIGKLDQNVDRLSSRLESIGTADLTAGSTYVTLRRPAGSLRARTWGAFASPTPCAATLRRATRGALKPSGPQETLIRQGRSGQ